MSESRPGLSRRQVCDHGGVCINAPCAMLELDSMFVLFVIMNVTTTFFVHTFYAELTIWLSGGDQGWVILFGSSRCLF